MKSGYICAGFETLSDIIHNYNIKNSDYFDPEKINNFFNQTVTGFLHSFGTIFSKTTKKITEKNINREIKIFEKARNTRFFDNSNFYVDSGGYQISAGFLNRDHTEMLINLYHKFLQNNHQVFDKAFLLDITPGPNDRVFKTVDDIYDYNIRTYTMAKEMPPKVRKKLIYIHHFRTPSLWNAFMRILDDDMFNAFDHFATGGMVASSRADTAIPCIIYVLPLIVLLNKAIKNKRKKLNFHILGGANFRDVFFYELFQEHVFNKHNIKLNITYDSSAIFKGLLISRRLPMFENNKVTFVNLKSKTLDMREGKELTNREIFFKHINSMISEFGFAKIKDNQIYDSENKSFLPEICIYAMLYYFYHYRNVQNYLKKRTQEIYHYYECQELERFIFECLETTQTLNNGKITKKQQIKSNTIVKSLDMLSDLDEDYCKYIVNKLLSKDEFQHLNDKSSCQVLTF